MVEKELEASLAHILGQIRQDKFGGRDAPTIRLSEGSGIGPDGKLLGELVVEIKKRNDEIAVIHKHSIDGITNTEELEGAFAETLSKVLAVHDKWPR